MGDYVGKETQPDVAFSLRIGFAEGVGGEGVVEDVALLEKVVKPNAASSCGHRGLEVGDTISLGDTRGFLGLANVFAIGGVVHYWPTPPWPRAWPRALSGEI